MEFVAKLPKTVLKSKKRVGRGAGSGRGKTAGRGTKGQKAREKVKAGFEGGQTPLTKRLPLKRGSGNYKSGKKPVIVNLKYLNLLPKDSQVTVETLIAAKIVNEKQLGKVGVKILGDGQIKIPLQVLLPISKKAAAKIAAAGGKVGIQETNETKATKDAKVTKAKTKEKVQKKTKTVKKIVRKNE